MGTWRTTALPIHPISAPLFACHAAMSYNYSKRNVKMDKVINSKLANAIVYVCNAFSDNPTALGSVKLNKILWFSDVEALKDRRELITGIDRYEARDFGPVIAKLPTIIRKLSDEGILSFNYIDSGDFQQWIYQITNNEQAQTMIDNIPQEHKDILNTWIEYARNNVVREIVKKAHDYSWWDDIDNGNRVPVHLGVLSELKKQTA